MALTGPEASRWHALGRVAAALVSLAALALVLRHVELANVGHTLARAQWRWIGGACAIFGVGFMMAAARWHLVLRMNQCQVHATATGKTVLIGHLFNTVLFGPTGGDLAKSALYARHYAFPVSSVLATCVVDRFLGGIGFFLFAGCTQGFALGGGGGRFSERFKNLAGSGRWMIWAGVLLLVVLAVLTLQRRFHWPSPFRKLTVALLSNVRQALRNPRMTAQGVCFALASHLCISGVFLFSLLAVTQTHFSILALLWTFPVMALVTSAPITFAGAGVREGAALYLLGLYGIPAGDAVAAALLVLLTYLVWALIGGVLLWRAAAERDAQEIEPLPRTISVIIPTLNEAQTLPETVARARAVPEVREIIVVDGGSTDSTCQLARQLGCTALVAPPSRGGQLRLGAAQASGDVLILLHADTWLPGNSGQALLNCLRDAGVVGGGFWKVFREKKLLMAGSRFRCALRLLLGHRVLGDQAMFVRRRSLEEIDGVPDIPLMEEFELCRRLRQRGRLALAGATVTTSARRFARLGILRTYLRMWQVTAKYYSGSSPQELRRIYEKD